MGCRLKNLHTIKIDDENGHIVIKVSVKRLCLPTKILKIAQIYGHFLHSTILTRLTQTDCRRPKKSCELKLSMQCWIARDNPLYFDDCGTFAQNPIILP